VGGADARKRIQAALSDTGAGDRIRARGDHRPGSTSLILTYVIDVFRAEGRRSDQ
jgi:hypothetical protein